MKASLTPHMNEIYIRLGFFFGVFAVMAVLELIAPRRVLKTSKAARWFNNLSITFIDSAAVRLIFPLMAFDVAKLSAERGWGIFNNIGVPVLTAGVISVIVLDLIIYLQHVAVHYMKPLWMFHRMHHTDLDFDVTTGTRFHPGEIVLSMGIKIVSVIIIGAPPWSVVAFEVLLNATSMFNHSNVKFPPGLDRALRLFVVTPDMHRVHHSVIINEYNSNFGFNLPWWDRIFKTYKAQPDKGHIDMNIGLANFRDPKELGLAQLLAIPFIKGKQ
ncbi:MAG: sterol desaturase family protein [Nitrospiraceae bacterium]|nr:MAG: sterol desaturase family protein [Nitrospiraceae bacterium]